jgi:hypothetical protein
MADSGIKKVVIPRQSLPAPNAETGKYIVRYRIVSEDRNRISHWSPQYLISPVGLTQDQYATITVNNTSEIITVTWGSLPESELINYEIYIAWGATSSLDPEEYYTTTSGNFTVIPIPNGKSFVKIWVQAPSANKTRSEALIVTSTDVASGNVSGVISLT